MSKVRGNTFDFNTDELNLDLDSINNINETIEFKDKSDNIIDASKSMANTIEITSLTITEVNLTYDNFKDYHYKLMNGKFLSMYHIKDTVNYVTYDGYCFTCSDPRLIKLISDIPKPLKISFDYADSVTMPIGLVAKILLGINFNSVEEIIRFFSKNEVTLDLNNCYAALIKVYRKLFNLINEYSLVSYFNRERDLYLIQYKSYIRSKSCDIDTVLQNKKIELSKLENALTREISDKIRFKSSTDILKYIETKTKLPISLEDNIGDIQFIELNNLLQEVITLTAMSKNTTPILDLSENGLISSSIPHNYLLQSKDKVIIQAYLPHMYFNCLLSILRLNKYKVTGDSDNYLVNYLKSLDDEFDISLISTILLVIKALVCGLNTDSDIQTFLYDTENTLIHIDDIKVLYKFIEDNLQDLITEITTFNKSTYKNFDYKFIIHTDYSPLNKRLLHLVSKGMKLAILNTSNTINTFNLQNNNHIHICDISMDKVLLTCDESISNVAIDILNRTLPSIVSESLKPLKVTCYIDFLDLNYKEQ